MATAAAEISDTNIGRNEQNMSDLPPAYESANKVADGAKAKFSVDANIMSRMSYAQPRPSMAVSVREKDRKIGHRRVNVDGIVTYKKKPTSELMTAIQLAIGQSVGSLSSKPERDVLMQDFAVVESVFYPCEGSNLTPAHHCSDFRFKTYAPIAFRYFRELFNIQPDDFMVSLCDEPLQELINPGASGSIFYITHDDEFIIKTVQHKEAEFLTKLLPGYFLNISQNPRTLLPKFYGLYCYQCGGKNIRFTVMNNLLPSAITLHEKYDLKGSTYKRKASKHERLKDYPTYKDLDFIDIHPEGILLEKEAYDALMKTLQRDCRVLESFKIMDYSLLVGVHNLDLSLRAQGLPVPDRMRSESTGQPPEAPPNMHDGTAISNPSSGKSLQRGKSFKAKIAQYSTALEAIRLDTDRDDDLDDEDVPPGGIPAKNSKGERILLYLGLIDILQSYRLKKKLEHTMKAIVIDGDTISVHRPGYYANRFLNFFANRVFKRMPTLLKHSPSKKKGQAPRPRAQTTVPEPPDNVPGGRRQVERVQRGDRTISFSDDPPRPDLLPDTLTPPSRHSGSRSPNGTGDQRRSDLMTSTTYQSDDVVPARYMSSLRSSPPLSLSESTPTHTDHTEGTPSFTASSPSCSSDVLDSVMTNDFGPSPMSMSPDQVSPSKGRLSSSLQDGVASYSNQVTRSEERSAITEEVPGSSKESRATLPIIRALSTVGVEQSSSRSMQSSEFGTSSSQMTGSDVTVSTSSSSSEYEPALGEQGACAASSLQDLDDEGPNYTGRMDFSKRRQSGVKQLLPSLLANNLQRPNSEPNVVTARQYPVHHRKSIALPQRAHDDGDEEGSDTVVNEKMEDTKL